MDSHEAERMQTPPSRHLLVALVATHGMMGGWIGCGDPESSPPLPPPSPECTEDSDCAANETCFANRCAPAQDITEPEPDGSDVVDDISDASETAEDVIDGLDEDVQDIQDAQLPDIDIAPPPGACATHIHCPALRLCNDEGDCIEPPLCLSDADCDEGRVCDRGKCAATHTGCGSDADCVANGDCDLATNECVNKTSCESAADCVGESVCAGGESAAKRCSWQTPMKTMTPPRMQDPCPWTAP